jgi:hypothetical protein
MFCRSWSVEAIRNADEKKKNETEGPYVTTPCENMATTTSCPFVYMRDLVVYMRDLFAYPRAHSLFIDPL